MKGASDFSITDWERRENYGLFIEEQFWICFKPRRARSCTGRHYMLSFLSVGATWSEMLRRETKNPELEIFILNFSSNHIYTFIFTSSPTKSGDYLGRTEAVLYYCTMWTLYTIAGWCANYQREEPEWPLWECQLWSSSISHWFRLTCRARAYKKEIECFQIVPQKSWIKEKSCHFHGAVLTATFYCR